MTDSPPKITLPCDFTIKIIGADTEDFSAFVKKSVLHHFPKTKDKHWNKQVSNAGKFVSHTVTVYLCDDTDMTALKQKLETHGDFKLML